MAKVFDRTPLLETLPSFYRNYLDGQDLDVLAALWEGVIRILDAEYARAVQVGASNKVSRARATTLYPWVRVEPEWQSNHTRHQHCLVEVTSSDDQNFYLGRYLDPGTIRLYYEGVPVALTPQDVVTQEPDSAQVAGTEPYGTRVTLAVARTPAGSGTMAADGHEVFVSQFVADGAQSTVDVTWDTGSGDADAEVDQDQWRITVRSDDITAAVTVTDGATTTPTIAYPSGFLAGQTLEAVRADGSTLRHTFLTDASSVTLAASTGVAITTVRLVLNFSLFPNAVAVTAESVTFSGQPGPGIRVRVTDSAGSQSFTTRKGVRAYKLDAVVDPDRVSVFAFGVDLLGITASSVDVDLGRPPRSGTLIELEAPYDLDHDHTRYRVRLSADSSVISVPATRPMVLTAGLDDDPRYPVHVIVDGVRLDRTEYSFLSTTSVQKTTGSFSRYQGIDIVYTDAETAAQHAHETTEIQVYASQGVSALELSSAAEADVYPAWVDVLGGSIIQPARVVARTDGNLSIIPELVSMTDATVRVTSARYRPRYQATLSSISDESEAYVGTIVTAESIQDGIDSPTSRVVLGAGLAITRDGDATLIESDLGGPVVWLQNAEVDEHTVSEILGTAVGLPDEGETTLAYLDAIRALYAAYYRGSQLGTLENLACLILGSAYAPEAGRYRGVEASGDTKVVNLLGESGETTLLPVDPNIPLRTLGSRVEALDAVNQSCVIVDRDLSNEPYLAYFAQAISADYAYAKRLDVRTPTTLVSAPTSYDPLTGVLVDNTVNFYEEEVWPGDLIAFSTAGATSGALVIDSVVAYSRVVEVLSATSIRAYTELDTQGYGWGDTFGWGETVGWGGASIADSIESYVIWNRRTRRLDDALHFDEMLNEAQALAHGESIQEVNTILAGLLRHFFFVVRIDWYAQTDEERLRYLRHFLDTAKPADVGYFAYTAVQNDGITDVLTIGVADRDPDLHLLGRYLYVGQDAVASCAVAPSLVADPLTNVEFGPGWWDPTT